MKFLEKGHDKNRQREYDRNRINEATRTTFADNGLNADDLFDWHATEVVRGLGQRREKKNQTILAL